MGSAFCRNHFEQKGNEMLPEGLWKPWEPHSYFPVFSQAHNLVDFVVQPTFKPALRDWARPANDWLKKRKTLRGAARTYLNMVLQRPIDLRGVFITRQGEFVQSWKLRQGLGVGDFHVADINTLLFTAGKPLVDGVFVLVASRGRPDLWESSPGSATVRYVGENFVAGYRTGFFARTVNPVHGKKHFGFTGINPQVLLGDGLQAWVMLINHSSDPTYDQTVSPRIRLYRAPDEYLETEFGPIAPHGALERSVLELFPAAPDFLAKNGGRGLTVATASGASLASIHILRNPANGSMGMDHSRPAHANVVDYL